MHENNFIDVIVPWVDGSDSKHREKKSKYTSDENEVLVSSVSEQRFIESNEIYFCINSIMKFMPWVRSIYLVTDNQIPSFLKKDRCKYHKVKIVDHKDIFLNYEDFLPCFNSRVIASLFWRIEGLSEKFIVFNDDLIVLDYVSKELFIKNSKIVIYGKFYQSKIYRKYTWLRKIISFLRYKLRGVSTSDRADVAQRTASKLGFKNKFVLQNHSPMLFAKESFRWFFSQEELEEQIKYRFRSTDQYLPEAINAHYLLKESQAIVSDEKITFELYDQNFKDPAFSFDQIFHEKICFLCAQSVELYPGSEKKELYSRLTEILDLS